MTETLQDSPDSGGGELVRAEPRRRDHRGVKVFFTAEYQAVRGFILLLLEVSGGRLERVLVRLLGPGEDPAASPADPWLELEQRLKERKPAASTQLAEDVEAYFRKVMQDELGFSLIDAVRNDSLTETKKLMLDLISRAIADAHIALDLGLETVKPEERAPAAAEKAGAASPAAEAARPGETPAVTRVKVDPILSPAHGVPARRLLPGMHVSVEVRDKGTGKPEPFPMLSAKMGGLDRGLHVGKVLAVTPAEFDRVNITLQLTPHLIGLCNIAGELKVKVSEAAKHVHDQLAGPAAAPPPPGIPSRHFWAGVIVILLVMLLLAYLVFGGVI